MDKSVELQVWQRVAGLAQSPSHDFQHIQRVQTYADELGKALGVETDLVRLAAILHDLGRGDEKRRHGLSSIEASKEMAEEVLRHLDLSEEARRTVIDAIESHDQPELSPHAPAARILKDADFLAGFGAWGVLRIAMWSGETGRRVDDVLHAMTVGMQRRLRTLEYPESRDAARRELIFARQFQGELERPVKLDVQKYKGFYCVLEGISGVGKNTVAKALSEKLGTLGHKVQLVEEPGETFRKLRDVIPNGLKEDFVPLRKALLIADRAEQFRRVVEPRLSSGDVVLSVRSYLSTAVYQSQDRAESYRTLLEHDWVPTADVLLLLDTNVDVALARIEARKKARGDFETPTDLAVHKERYLEFATSFPARRIAILDATQTLDEVVAQSFDVLRQELDSKRLA